MGKVNRIQSDREYTLDAAKKLLTGIFNNIKSFDDPVVMPRVETEVSYPRDYSSFLEVSKEIFEGLTRSFFIAAPLIVEFPDLTINNINIKEYYKKHVLRCIDERDSEYVGSYSDLCKMNPDNPYACYQQTVETCALVICLEETKALIWNTYSQSERDKIAEFLKGYAYGNTVPQNWRLFNMLDLAFLNMHGYEIDKSAMNEHLAAILGYYAGDGWYRDGHSFDFYSCWAFNVYGPIWNNWYGYENCPAAAEIIEARSNELIKNFASFFDKEGFTLMWGRSSIYRFASTSAFAGNMMLRHHGTDYGLYRHIVVGALRQFMDRDDFLGSNNIPTMGFYGQFSPLVQGYSCAESVFWMGKAFLVLSLPKNHPFWTMPYDNEYWNINSPRVSVYDAPGLCTANFPLNGETVLRSGKVLKNKQDIHGMFNYSKLSYNTKFPWEAVDFAESYILKDIYENKILHPNVTFWNGEKDNVLYRRQYFDFDLETERHWIQSIALADFTVDYGIIRCDRTRFFKKPVEIRLGAYGFPDNGTEIKHIKSELNGRPAYAVILKGFDSQKNPRQMAFTVYEGFSDIMIYESENTNPDSKKSLIPYAVMREDRHNRYEQQILVSQVITRESHSDFAKDSIFPIKDIIYTDPERMGGYGQVKIILKNKKEFIVDFNETEGKMSL